MFTKKDVLETIAMVEEEHLDIRTITMGISLLSCIRDSAEETARKVYDLVCKKAENIVKTASDLSGEYGIPIVNKRVSVTPVSLITANFPEKAPIVGKALDSAAKTLGIDFLGGYSALVHKGTAEYEEKFINTIPEVLAETERLCASVNVGSSKSGINMQAVKLMGEVFKRAAELTKDKDGIGAAKLVVFCNAVEANPFMAGAFHGVGEADTVINVGVSGPGVVKHALEQIPSADLTEVAELIKRTAFKITRAGQLVAKEASKRLNASFGIVDLSLAPTPAVGDSVAEILEDDLNTSNALTSILDQVKLLNTSLRTKEKNNDLIANQYASLMKMTDLVGFKFEVKELNDEEIELYQQWEAYKANKDFENADVVRQTLISKGVL